MVGLGAGAVFGLLVVALLEFRSVRIWHEKELEDLVPGRVLVAIPHLSVPREDRFRVLFHYLEVGAALGMTAVILVGTFYALYKG
jgi:hypothetical protein